MKTNEKASIIEAIAQYQAIGTQAIHNWFELYSQFGWELQEEEFYEKVVWVNNSNLQKINNINYMYNTDTEQWASEEEMAQEFDYIF